MSQPALTESHLGEPVTTAPGPGTQARARSSWELFWTRFRHDKAAVTGAVVIVVLVILALAAPLFARITGHGPNELFGREMLTADIGLPKGPNSSFWTRSGATCSCGSCTAPAPPSRWPCSPPASPP
jgi:hypothetical protein